MKIVSICGAQGEGKTTVLNELKTLGYGVVERKTSRSILADLDMTLEEVNKYPPLTKYFQNLIIERHSQIFLKRAQAEHQMTPDLFGNDIIFIERSFADIFTYALMALGSFNDYSDYMNEYYEKCKVLQNKFDKVICLRGRVTEDAQAESDGVRSVNKHFIRVVDSSIRRYASEMSPGNYHEVNTPNLAARVSSILDIAHGVSV